MSLIDFFMDSLNKLKDQIKNVDILHLICNYSLLQNLDIMSILLYVLEMVETHMTPNTYRGMVLCTGRI